MLFRRNYLHRYPFVREILLLSIEKKSHGLKQRIRSFIIVAKWIRHFFLNNRLLVKMHNCQQCKCLDILSYNLYLIIVVHLHISVTNKYTNIVCFSILHRIKTGAFSFNEILFQNHPQR